MAVRTGIFRADRFDDDETGGFVLELFGNVLADAAPRVTTRALLVGLGDIDLDAPPRQMRGQRPAACRPAPHMPTHRRLARIHFDGLGDGASLVGELLQRELELSWVNMLRFLPKEPLAQDIELVPQCGDFTLRLRQLLLQRGDEGARGGEIVDGLRERARLIHSLLLTTTARPLLTCEPHRWGHAAGSYQRRRRVCVRSMPESKSPRSPLRIVTGSPASSLGHANVPRSSRL